MSRASNVKMPTVARNMKYSESMRVLSSNAISDATARLINALLVDVMTHRIEVDWTTIKVTTRRIGQGTTWETVVSVEEKTK